MSDVFAGLKPELLWKHFFALTQIPRCSKQEEKVRAYVEKFAQEQGLEYQVDATGNIVIRKPATTGMENRPTVVLQGHLDMVCEKNKEVAHDFNSDPIKVKREGDWVKAEGTTLGADNGIGVATALAILESSDVAHPPLEALFTVDEETGLTGATQLEEGMLKGRLLLNLDSEEDGVIYIGCAGGRDTEFYLSAEREAIPSGYVPVTLKVTGLQGGHSGLNIHEGRANALKLMARFLWKAGKEMDIRLAWIEGGNKHNAIPRECEAVVYVKSEEKNQLEQLVNRYQQIYQDEFALVEKELQFSATSAASAVPQQVFSKAFQNRLVNLLYAMPHGVMGMSLDVPGLVETSTNLAVIRTGDAEVGVLTSQRSSVATRLDEIVEMVTAVGELVGARIRHGNGYPAWKPNPNSPLLQKAKAVYKDLFGKEPEVKAIHAGLETGIIGDKFPGMDMISFGPTILGAHSPEERVQISTVEKFWNFLLALLKNIDAA